MVREGRLCPDAVTAVLTCAGHPTRGVAAARPAGLTPREIEVLRLIAAGQTAKQAARQLRISPKTADHHIQNLYSKIGVSTRAGAAVYALERGMVDQRISPASGILPMWEPGAAGILPDVSRAKGARHDRRTRP